MEFTKVKQGVQKTEIFKKRYILHLFLSFLLGRIFLMDYISPFAISYLCSYMNTQKRSPVKITLTVCASLLGIITTKYSYTVTRYLLAYVLFGLIYISSTTIWTKSIKYISQLSSLLAMAISGLIYYAQLENPVHNMSMLFFECALCAVFPYIIKTTADIICSKDIYQSASAEDVAGICILSVVAMGGFCSLYIGDISVGKALCGAFIMIIAYTGRCAFAVTCGVGLGIIFSLYSFDFNEYAGILGFCGLVTGLASGLKRPGIILAFTVSTRLLAIYFGGWSDTIFSAFETIISICLFCLIPRSVLLRIKAYFSTGILNNEEFKKYVSTVNSKIRYASKKFEHLAQLSDKIIGRIPENFNDISTIYDITANRVCKSCGLKSSCWGKNNFDTRDALNKTVSLLLKNGHISSEDVPVEFKRICIKYDAFANELNKTYFRYKASNSWQEKMEQGQKILSVQFRGMSDIIENFTEDINSFVTFDRLDECKIMYNMEQADIKCYDVTVVKDHTDTASVTAVIKEKNKKFTALCRLAEMIISDALGRPMKTEGYSRSKNKITVRFRETEKFSVECSYISIPKKGEITCGDSVIHGKISGGKYTLILSDGMGCGEAAAQQSLTAAELMKQFLNAGFDKSSSVEMINSTLILKNSEIFSTLDAVIVDMFTARTEFIKSGANTSYIKSGECIKKISSDTLPIGIINSTKAETKEYKAKNGDIIILISDGVHNAADDWFEQYILNMHEDNPEIIAKLLAEEAKRQKNQDDDMTVAVLKITENGR